MMEDWEGMLDAATVIYMGFNGLITVSTHMYESPVLRHCNFPIANDPWQAD